MSIEQRINYQLNKFPRIKKIIKRVYQRTMYSISPKIRKEGAITRVSPDDKSHEYFFGLEVVMSLLLEEKAGRTQKVISIR